MWLGQSMLMWGLLTFCRAMNSTEKLEMRTKVKEMFYHAYNGYMNHAYPADELMPISCQGRYRGSHKSRGDIDDALGNFSLTLIDSLDTLAVLGELAEFEQSVIRVIKDVTFDKDIVVSVFETNIRVLGGLLGAHVMSRQLQKTRAPYMSWYADQLLSMAADIGKRLLPAFNTSTGIPYPRVNLIYGITDGVSRAGKEHDTCTACAGTIILEFAALSRLTGDPVFEEKAKRAMSYLWKQRHRSSDLVGTVINIHNGDWVRRDSGVGAGIDSYYEYLLKAYVLLGDQTYLERFDKHYDAVMKYINQGPMLLDVHMHKPTSNSKHFMDALQAFWPGLQVLKGDIKPAIEIHEMLYQLVQRHNFLPEAFTTDFRIHWAHHPLRPEFLESTYFLYKATGDEHYLDVGRTVLENLDSHARVKCGFAAIQDVTTGVLDDQMDSYVLAEFFKYLYLLFSEPGDEVIDVDDYIFTTEAHLLPLTLSMHNYTQRTRAEFKAVDKTSLRTCPNSVLTFPNQDELPRHIRNSLKDFVAKICPKKNSNEPRLRARDFVAGNKDQLYHLKRMGIKIVTMNDGRVQLLHTASEASSTADAEEGMIFMQEMIDLSKSQGNQLANQEPVYIQVVSVPYFGSVTLRGGPAQFGLDLKETQEMVRGPLLVAEPYDGCTKLRNAQDVAGRIVVVERGGCLFIDKARRIQSLGGLAGIVVDNNADSSMENTMLFSMSGDGKHDVTIPVVFLFAKEGATLLHSLDGHKNLEVALTYKPLGQDSIMKDMLDRQKQLQQDILTAEGMTSSSTDQSTTGTSSNIDQSTSDTSSNTDKSTGDTSSNTDQSTGDTSSNTEQSTTYTSPENVERLPSQIIEGGDYSTKSTNEALANLNPVNQEQTTTIEVDGVQIKVKGQQALDALIHNPAVQITQTSKSERKLRLDIDRLFNGKPRSEIQYEELTHRIFQLISESIVDFSQNEDYLNAVRTMIHGAVSTMNVGLAADESENESESVDNESEEGVDRVVIFETEVGTGGGRDGGSERGSEKASPVPLYANTEHENVDKSENSDISSDSSHQSSQHSISRDSPTYHQSSQSQDSIPSQSGTVDKADQSERGRHKAGQSQERMGNDEL